MTKSTFNLYYLLIFLYVLLSALLDISFINIILVIFCTIYIATPKRQESIYLIIMLIPLMDIMAFYGVPLLNFLVVFLFFVYVVKIKSRKKEINYNIFILFVIFLMYELIHYCFYPPQSYIELLEIVIWTMSFLLFGIIISSKNWGYSNRMAQKFFIIGTGYSIIYGYIERIKVSGLSNLLNAINTNDRSYGASGDPNYYSLYIILSVIFMIDLLRVNKKNYIIKLFIIFIYIMSGLLSVSRMYISLLVFIILFLMIFLVFKISKKIFEVSSKTKKISIKKLGKIVITIITLAVLTSLFWGVINSNISTILSRFQYASIDSLTSNRNVIFKSYIDYSTGDIVRLLFGIGMVKYNIRSGIGPFAHNFYIEALVAWGIVGLAFILIIVLIIKLNYTHNNRKKRTRVDAIKILPLLTLLFAGFFLNILEIESFYLLIFLCLPKFEDSDQLAVLD